MRRSPRPAGRSARSSSPSWCAGGAIRRASTTGCSIRCEFHAWNKAERRYAPPLVVELDGADLHAGALIDFADGREKIVLVVRGAAAPAPLVRCITPGTLVLQTTDGSGLDLLAGFDGPAVAARGARRRRGRSSTTRRPGAEPWQRLTVTHHARGAQAAIGGVSAWQMAEDLTLLGDLARTPFAIPVSGGAGRARRGRDDAVDRLAAWLLGQIRI